MPSRNTKAWYSSSSTWEPVLSRGKALHYHYITGDSPLEATVGQSECKSAEMKQIGVRQSEHPGFSWHGRIPSWVMKLNLKKENGQGERGGKKKNPTKTQSWEQRDASQHLGGRVGGSLLTMEIAPVSSCHPKWGPCCSLLCPLKAGIATTCNMNKLHFSTKSYNV